MDESSNMRPAVSRGHAAPGRLAVLYDSKCDLCQASAKAVRMFDNSGAIDLVDIHDSEQRRLFPDLRVEHLMEELHVVNDLGQIHRGARAVNEVLRYQRGVRGLLAWLWYIPGYAWLADRQYKRIAGTRYN